MTWPLKDDLGFVVQKIFMGGKSGILRVLRPPVRRSLYFRDGRFVFAHSNVKNEKLGRILIQHGFIESEQELKDIIERKQHQRLGEFLLEQGMITPDELHRILDLQVRIIFTRAFYSDGTLEWEEKPQPIYKDLQLPIHLEHFLEEVILSDPKPDRYHKRIPPETYWIQINDKPIFNRHQLQSEDNLLSSLLTEPLQIKDIFRRANLSRDEIARRLYLGLVFGQFKARPPEQFAGAARGLYSLSNPQLNPLPPDWRAFAQRVDHMSPLEAFAIPADASLELINKRYHQLCDWLHPIYYDETLPREERKRVKYLIDRLSDYYEILKTTALARSSQHLKLIPSGEASRPPTPPEILKQVRLEIERGQYIRAARILRENQQILRKFADYYLFSGIILSHQKETWKQAEASFKKALELEPNNIEILLEFASFYDTIGLRLKAFDLLRRVLAIDPNHFRARELLRLYQKKEGT